MRNQKISKLIAIIFTFVLAVALFAVAAGADTMSNKLSLSPKGDSDKVFKRVVTILEDAGYEVYESDKDIGKIKARKKLGSTTSFLSQYNNYSLVDAKVRDRGERSTITMTVGVHQDMVGAVDGKLYSASDYTTLEAIEAHGLTTEIAKEVGSIKEKVQEEFGMDEGK